MLVFRSTSNNSTYILCTSYRGITLSNYSMLISISFYTNITILYNYYRFHYLLTVTHRSCGSMEKQFISPYAEVYPIDPPHCAELRQAYSPRRVSLLSAEAPMSPLLSAQENRITRESYDILCPPLTEPSSASTPRRNLTHLLSHHRSSMRTTERRMYAITKTHSVNAKDRAPFLSKSLSFPSKTPPSQSPAHKHPPKEPENEQLNAAMQKSDDLDTYVYMAPLNKFTEATDIRSQLMNGVVGKSIDGGTSGIEIRYYVTL